MLTSILQFPSLLGLSWLGFVLCWLAAGWLTCGLAIWSGKVTGPVNRTMGYCLGIWPAVVLAMAVALLARAALFVFHPETGPLALGRQLLRDTADTPLAPPVPTEVKS